MTDPWRQCSHFPYGNHQDQWRQGPSVALRAFVGERLRRQVEEIYQKDEQEDCGTIAERDRAPRQNEGPQNETQAGSLDAETREHPGQDGRRQKEGIVIYLQA